MKLLRPAAAAHAVSRAPIRVEYKPERGVAKQGRGGHRAFARPPCLGRGDGIVVGPTVCGATAVKGQSREDLPGLCYREGVVVSKTFETLPVGISPRPDAR